MLRAFRRKCEPPAAIELFNVPRCGPLTSLLLGRRRKSLHRHAWRTSFETRLRVFVSLSRVSLSACLPHGRWEPPTVTAGVFGSGTRLLVPVEPAEAWQGL